MIQKIVRELALDEWLRNPLLDPWDKYYCDSVRPLIPDGSEEDKLADLTTFVLYSMIQKASLDYISSNCTFIARVYLDDLEPLYPVLSISTGGIKHAIITLIVKLVGIPNKSFKLVCDRIYFEPQLEHPEFNMNFSIKEVIINEE